MVSNGDRYINVLDEAEEEFSSVMDDLQRQMDAVVLAAQTAETERLATEEE